MTELELYKFIEEQKLEIGWRGYELVLWVDFIALDEFAEMIRSCLDDGGVDVNLQLNCVALDIVPICDYYGIDPHNICKEE